MKTVREILLAKGDQIFSVQPDSLVFEALKLMADKGIGALLVMDKEGNPVGVMSERDYARKVILVGKSSKETLVKEIMSSQVIYIEPERGPEEERGLATRLPRWFINLTPLFPLSLRRRGGRDFREGRSPSLT